MINGVINVYKEPKYTSHDVVQVLRKIFKQKKIGHTGTLDPMAEGVLPVCLGKGTKIAEMLTAESKVYKTVLRLGKTTDTQDAEGTVLSTQEVKFHPAQIKKCIESFVGTYWQVPPMYSALKINGQKLYDLARAGKEVEREPRKLFIYKIDITRWIPPDGVEMIIHCSKGTYIRTLCADIGEKVQCGGYMDRLLRIQSGDFSIEDALTLQEIEERYREEDTGFIYSMDEVIHYPKIKILSDMDSLLYNGNVLPQRAVETSEVALHESLQAKIYDSKGNFIGIHQVVLKEKSYYLKPIRMLYP